MPSIRLALGLAAVGLFVVACDSTSNADPSAPTRAGAGGTIVGKLLTSDGRPIERAEVSYDGWPEGAQGTMANGRINSPANGHVEATGGRYEIKVPPGQYTTGAEAIVTWHDRPYRFQLETADGSDDTARAGVGADTGVARDYVWKMSGVRRGRDAAYVGSGWERNVYGAWIDLDLYQSDTDKYQPTQPDLRKTNPDDRVEFTLAPKGKLIDGSEGKTIVEQVEIKTAGQYGCGVRGIPMGDYTVTARLVRPGGAAEPLRVSLTPAASVPGDDSSRRVPWAASADVVFPPEEMGPLKYYGMRGVSVYVGK